MYTSKNYILRKGGQTSFCKYTCVACFNHKFKRNVHTFVCFLFKCISANNYWYMFYFTVPETFYLPILLSLTVRSQAVHRVFNERSSFTIFSSAFTVRSRSSFTKCSVFVHRASTYRSKSVHRSFSVFERKNIKIMERTYYNR